jgi:hypothetical protein
MSRTLVHLITRLLGLENRGANQKVPRSARGEQADIPALVLFELKRCMSSLAFRLADEERSSAKSPQRPGTCHVERPLTWVESSGLHVSQITGQANLKP